MHNVLIFNGHKDKPKSFANLLNNTNKHDLKKVQTLGPHRLNNLSTNPLNLSHPKKTLSQPHEEFSTTMEAFYQAWKRALV
jgi:hypothetical protein